MQVEGDWKAAANLTLLLGNAHPPARLEKPLLTAQQQRLTAGNPSAVVIDARNTANFRNSSYCGLQEKTTPTVRRHIIAHYRDLLRRIPLWRSAASSGSGGSGVKKQAGSDASADVKPEPQDDDEQTTLDDLQPAVGGGSGVASVAHSIAAPLFRAVGILTEVQDPSAVSTAVQQAPWEFYVIRDVEDDDCYTRALQAMTHEPSTTSAPFMLLQESAGRSSAALGGGSPRPSGGGGSGAMAGVSAAGEETDATKAEADAEAAAQDGTRLSLYTRQVPQFTGLYPGMAVGIVGEAFQRSARGVLTGVLVRDFILPARPVLPWRVDRPLPPPHDSQRDTNASSNHYLNETGSNAARIHFCSGPFPRRDVAGLLRTVTLQALHRGADLLIIGGPFIPPFTNEFERGLLPTLGATFNETMESFVDTLEETLKNYYSTRPLLPHMRVVLVSHKGDVTQIPVLPTTMYAIADTADILVRSNPCRISLNGVHVSVCNDDAVGAMRERMVERWPTVEGSLRRVVEALVDGRLYTPLYGFPVPSIDVKHLPQLRMDYVPAHNELLELESTDSGDGGASSVGSKAPRGMEGEARWDSGSGFWRSWAAVMALDDDGTTAALKAEVKRAKMEPAEEHEATPTGAAVASPSTPSFTTVRSGTASTEFLPHIMFLPSTRPQFAVVTHQSEEVDGADLDNTARASGVLVVNQEVWSTRSSPKFQLRVAEVTMPNTEVVLRRGATAASGVACGVLNIYSASS